MPDHAKPPNSPAETRLAATREERLAAKLRENLRRRKAQAREIGGDAAPGLSKEGSDG